MAEHPTIYELADAHALRVGQFITRWAYLEWRLREAMYALMGVGPKIGRVAIREPRVVDYLTMIEDAAQLRAVTISIKWPKLKEIFKEMESWRDRFAHGVWLDADGSGTPTLQVLNGKTVERAGGPSTKSRINPRGVRVPIEQLDNAIRGIDRAVKMIDEIKREIEAQVKPAPSPGKSA